MRPVGLIAYLVIAFGVAWGIELGPVRRIGYATGRPAVLALLVIVMFTPALAAVVARLVEKRGFEDAGLRVGVARYHLAAWLLPFGVAVVAVGLTVALGFGRLDLSMASALERIPAAQKQAAAAWLARYGAWVPVLTVVGTLTQGVVITSIATFGEEFGWRGYLLPRLLHLGPVRSMALVGVIWGIWHAPIIVQGHNYPGHPAVGVVLMIAFTTAWSVILGWLFLASRSVLAPTIGHASINSPAASLAAFIAGANPLLAGMIGLPGVAVAGLVALWLWLSGRLKVPAADPL